MTDCPSPDQLRRMIEAGLPDEAQAAAEDHVDQCPACQQLLEQLTTPAPAGRPPAAADPTAETFVARVQGLAPLPERPRVTGPIPLPTVAGYEVEAEVGRGGMGVVYRARHRRLNRLVALKMLTDYGASDPSVRARFLVEAEAVAQLRHPHVVQVYEFGEHAGRPYLAMEYVNGGTLADRLAAGTRVTPIQAAELVAQLADAVAAAHQQGIIHRDLKPSNILLTAAGPDAAAVPKVTDFGIARVSRSELTATGEILGTPSYMAPEQAAGKVREVGTTTDVYGLGAILYELLAGCPPFLGETAIATLQQVVNTDPRPPRAVTPGVPRDLDTICRKCLEKAPAKRYPTADALAADLRAYLTGRTISARPAGTLERSYRWTRRHPAWATLGVVTVTATVALVAVLAVSYARVREAADHQAAERRRAEQIAARAEITRGILQCEDGDTVQGLDHLSRAVALADQGEDADLGRAARVNVAAWLTRVARPVRLYDTPTPNRPLDAIMVAADGRVVTAAGDAGEVRVWADGPGGPQVVGQWAGVPRAVRFKSASAVAIIPAPGGETVYIAHANGRVWRRPVRDPAAPPAPPFDFVPVTPAALAAAALNPDADAVFPTLQGAALSRDGRWLAVGLANGTVRVIDVDRRVPVGADIRAHSRAGVYGVGFTRDGKLLTGGAWDEAKLWAWDGTAWRLRTAFRIGRGGMYRLAVWTGGGHDLALIGGDQSTSLWELGDVPQRLWEWPHAQRAGAVAFSPDGTVCVTADHAGNVRCSDVETGAPVARFRNPSQVRAVAFSPDGRHLLVGDTDGRATSWQLPAPLARAELPVQVRSPGASAVGFDPTGPGVWMTINDGLRFWTPTPAGRYQPDEARQGAGRYKGSVATRVAALAPDGEVAVAADWHVTDMHVGPVAGPPTAGRTREVQAEVEALGFVPGGRSFFTLTRDPVPDKGRLRWWTAGPTGAVEDDARRWPPLPAAACVAARPPHGDLVLLGQRAGHPTGFRTGDTGAPIGPPLPHPRTATVTAAAFDPTGTLAATACQDGSIRVWSVPAGEAVAGPFSHKDKVNQLAFGTGPAAGVLVAASDDGTARFWDVRTGLPLGPALRYSGPVLAVAIDPTGERVITGARMGPVRIWAVPPPPIPGSPADVEAAVRAATDDDVLNGPAAGR